MWELTPPHHPTTAPSRCLNLTWPVCADTRGVLWMRGYGSPGLPYTISCCPQWNLSKSSFSSEESNVLTRKKKVYIYRSYSQPNINFFSFLFLFCKCLLLDISKCERHLKKSYGNQKVNLMKEPMVKVIVIITVKQKRHIISSNKYNCLGDT